MSAPEDDPISLVDRHRSACLRDVGLDGYMAAVCVSERGEDVLVLVSRQVLAAGPSHAGDNVPAHERTGRLPGVVRERIWGDALRCGRTRSDGQPCRHRVKERGQTCRAHAGMAASPPRRGDEEVRA